MGLLDLIRKKNNIRENFKDNIKNNALVKIGYHNQFDYLLIHEDIQELIWVEDGIKKNYIPQNTGKHKFSVGDFEITMSFNNSEPSLINTKLPISKISNVNDVERPPYYPSYYQLSNDQRGVYWEFLKNPYNPEINIGYVFIFYYGLERHLFEGDFENAFDIILKLRDVHSNQSFQFYSASALILSCLYHQRADLVKLFMDSLDKDYEKNIPINLLLLCKYSLDIPFTADEIMRSAKSFEFKTLNYIKTYPELFEKELKKSMFIKTKSEEFNLKNVITVTEFKKLKYSSIKLFANYSIQEDIKVPLIIESFKLKKDIFNLLEETHINLKEELKVLRKNGNLPTSKKIENEKIVKIFDENLEKELLEDLSKSLKKPVERHFAYNSLIDFYYKNRNISATYIDKCVDYCLLDINNLEELNKSYIEQEVKTIKSSSFYNSSEKKDKIEKICYKGFVGNIPSFKRLVIIYEKQNMIEEAIRICEIAIKYGQTNDGTTNGFEGRLENLKKKSC